MATAKFKPHFFLFVCFGCLLDSTNDDGVSAQIPMNGEFPYIIVSLAWVISFDQEVKSLDDTASTICRGSDIL